MIPAELQDVLTTTPDVLSGAVRFVGTRVPVQALLDSLQSNRSVDFFLDGYPDVTRDQAQKVIAWELNQAREALGLDKVA